jgi:hypothetical protein
MLGKLTFPAMFSSPAMRPLVYAAEGRKRWCAKIDDS